MILVIAEMKVKPENRDVLLTSFREIVPQVRKERGCIEYAAALDTSAGLPGEPAPRDDVLVVLERWESPEALREHFNAPLLQSFFQKTQGLIESVTTRVLRPVE